jgi:hypothetical protein
VGSWSGYLFGLVQDFAKGDDAVDGLALAYADEQRVTNSTGHVTQLILQVKVRQPCSRGATVSLREPVIGVGCSLAIWSKLQLHSSAPQLYSAC